MINQRLTKPFVPLQDRVIISTCLYFGIPNISAFKKSSKAGPRINTYYRHVCYYLLKEYTQLNCKEIGELFETRFSTIHSAMDTINDRLTLKSEHRKINGDLQAIRTLIDNFTF